VSAKILQMPAPALYLYGLLLLGGCAPVPVVPQTVSLPDGAVVAVTPELACANLAVLCGADPAACVTNLAALAGGSPLDLACMTSAQTEPAAKSCVGVGALCP
jgi:hypothetical protein